MPTYDFKCPACERTTSEIRSMLENKPAPTCPECNKQMKRSYGAPTIQFKGAGFYSNEKEGG